MKLYYSPGACSLADHIALVESGLSFEIEKVDLKAQTTKSGADFKSINPKGYVPALELDEKGILTENIAILSYIADRSGKLAPGDSMQRFRVIEALAYISTELHKNFNPFFKPDATEAEKEAAREVLIKRFAFLEPALQDEGYLLGNFSVADCYLFVMIFWATKKVKMDVSPTLQAYFDRLSDREAVRTALSNEGIG